MLRVFGKSPELEDICTAILCSRTEVSLYSAAEEVAGDSGVQGRKSSRSPEIADAVGRIPVGPNSVGFKPSSGAPAISYVCILLE